MVNEGVEYLVHLPYRGVREVYTTKLVLYQCLNCGYSWWDESLPDPIVGAVKQYIKAHGPLDRESKHLMTRFGLTLDTL